MRTTRSAIGSHSCRLSDERSRASHATPSRTQGQSLQSSGRYPSRIQKYIAMPCDAGAGALMAEAGLQGALLNVEINLGLIHDEAFKERTQAQLEPLKRAAASRQAILHTVRARM